MLQILQFYQKQYLTSIYYCMKYDYKRYLLFIKHDIAKKSGVQKEIQNFYKESGVVCC